MPEWPGISGVKLRVYPVDPLWSKLEAAEDTGNELVAQIGDDSETILLRVRLLYRAVAGGNETLVARLLGAGVPVEDSDTLITNRTRPKPEDTDTLPQLVPTGVPQ